MNAPALVDHLRVLEVDLSVSATGKLHIEAPVGTLTDELRSAIRVHREALIASVNVDAHQMAVAAVLATFPGAKVIARHYRSTAADSVVAWETP